MCIRTKAFAQVTSRPRSAFNDDGELLIDVRADGAGGQERVIERYTMRKHEGANVPSLRNDESFLDAYAIALRLRGDAIAAVKAHARKVDMSDRDARALIDGYCG